MIASMWQDLRFGARMLRLRPGFSLIAVFTLALGVGANTAIFSVVNALLLRPLPFLEADRLVLLTEKLRDGGRNGVPYPNFEDWRTRAQSFAGMAISGPESFNLIGADNPRRLSGRRVNWNFFTLLGVNPQLGRWFTETDDHYGAARTVVISHAFWLRQFGGAADVIGKTVFLTTDSYTVIGVLPPGFEYFEAADVYVPVGLFLRPDTGLTDRGSSFGGMYALARLKSGVTIQQANNEMAALAQQLAQEYPQVNEGKSAQAEALQEVMSESVRRALWLLLGAVALILLIACINVANLMLVRASERQKEIALRLALGAARWRIMRQLLSESWLIAALGAAGGLLLGRWMLAGLLALAPPEIPGLSRVGLDTTVLLFTLGIAMLTSLLIGLLPAVNDVKTNSVDRPTTMQTYLLFQQNPGTVLGLIVRTQGDPPAVVAPIQQAIHAIDPDLPIYAVWTMDQLLGNSLAQRRLTLVLLGSFASLALLLAAIGIYGVIAYTVRLRTNELGIRMALGAQTGDILRMILGQGLKLASIGVILGLAAAFALTRLMESLLFEVRPADPLTFGLIAVVLLCVALVACWIPARRATKVNPLDALRSD